MESNNSLFVLSNPGLFFFISDVQTGLVVNIPRSNPVTVAVNYAFSSCYTIIEMIRFGVLPVLCCRISWLDKIGKCTDSMSLSFQSGHCHSGVEV